MAQCPKVEMVGWTLVLGSCLYLLGWGCSNGLALGTPVAWVVAHSHCDAGYRETFNDYFTTEVKSILDTVIEALKNDPDKRFVWEEVSFFSVWWKQASSEQRALVKELVHNKQLEFIGGGWVMHDEADTSMFGILNQMSLGLHFLNTTLEIRPQIEWHIDPFGHSIFMVELYSRLGYKAVILNRVPNPIKQEMRSNKGLEFYWWSPYTSSEMFVHVLDTHYTTPRITGIDVEEKAKSFVNICMERLQWYRSGNVLIPFGGDFTFQDAEAQFLEMDNVIDYINAHPEMFNLTVRYSTLSMYIDAVLNALPDIPTRVGGDFFPYVCCVPCLAPMCNGRGDPCGPTPTRDSYWSGFYTSKPTQKLLVRRQEASLRALQTMNSLFPNLTLTVSAGIELSRNTSALLQHHDAITGTSFPSCYDDYITRLKRALVAGEDSLALLKSAKMCGSASTLNLSSDSVSVLRGLTDGNVAAVVIQNPLDLDRDAFIEISLPEDLCVQVLTSTKLPVASQQIGTSLYVPLRLTSLGMQVLFLKKIPCTKKHQIKKVSGFSISNGVLNLDFDDDNHISGWSALGRNNTVRQSYIQYLEHHGIFEPNPCDGTNVYTFFPANGSKILTPKYIPTTIVANGPLVWEIEQEITSYITTTLRLYKPFNDTTMDIYAHFAEWQTKIGPLPSSPPNSVSSVFSTDLKSGNYFTTYTNGFYPMERMYNSSATLQDNTYPLVGRAHISDVNTGGSFTVISQRPMGLSAFNNSLEFMLHRRIPLLLDPRGDDASVMDDSVLVGFLKNDSITQEMISSRAMLEFQSPPTLHFSLLASIDLWMESCLTEWRPANQTLPQGILVVSREVLNFYSSGRIEVGIRFINVYRKSSFPITIDLGSMLSEWRIEHVQETSPDFLTVLNPSVCVTPEKPCDIVMEGLALRTFAVTLVQQR